VPEQPGGFVDHQQVRPAQPSEIVDGRHPATVAWVEVQVVVEYGPIETGCGIHLAIRLGRERLNPCRSGTVCERSSWCL
jgi:hypothetical protein